jgi:hypothetical protein
VLDETYVLPQRIGIESSITALGRFGTIAVYEFVQRPAVLQPDLAAR